MTAPGRDAVKMEPPPYRTNDLDGIAPGAILRLRRAEQPDTSATARMPADRLTTRPPATPRLLLALLT